MVCLVPLPVTFLGGSGLGGSPYGLSCLAHGQILPLTWRYVARMHGGDLSSGYRCR